MLNINLHAVPLLTILYNRPLAYADPPADHRLFGFQMRNLHLDQNEWDMLANIDLQ